MRKIIFAILFMAPVCAIAAEKCVALSGSTKCSGIDPSSYMSTADWWAKCPSSNGIPVRGISVCAKTSGSMGDVRDDLEISTTASENDQCWCKLLSPVVSEWVFLESQSPSTCANDCAHYCAKFSIFTEYTRGLFSSLKD